MSETKSYRCHIVTGVVTETFPKRKYTSKTKGEPIYVAAASASEARGVVEDRHLPSAHVSAQRVGREVVRITAVAVTAQEAMEAAARAGKTRRLL